MERIGKIQYYLDIAATVATRSTCMRRCFGAIIVKNDSIVATGYNGAPRGRKNCNEIRYCIREKLQIPRGERYELCRSVHAEQNAIIAAPRESMIGATLYLSCLDPVDHHVMGNVCSCSMCKRAIINAGIDKVVVQEENGKHSIYKVKDWIENDESLDGTKGY